MATDVKNDANLSTNLVSYYELEETSGTRVDSTATGNDLTDNNTVTSTTGLQGTAASFTGANSEYLSITDGSQSGFDFGAAAFSLVGWVKLGNTTDFHAFITKRGTGGTDAGYRFGIRNNVDNKLQLYTANGSSATALSSTGTITDTSTWHQVAVTRDGSGNVTFYLDGGASGTGSATENVSSASDFIFGAGEAAADKFATAAFDEWAIYSKELTSTEITDLYNSGAGIPYEATSTFIPQIIMS